MMISCPCLHLPSKSYTSLWRAPDCSQTSPATLTAVLPGCTHLCPQYLRKRMEHLHLQFFNSQPFAHVPAFPKRLNCGALCFGNWSWAQRRKDYIRYIVLDFRGNRRILTRDFECSFYTVSWCVGSKSVWHNRAERERDL